MRTIYLPGPVMAILETLPRTSGTLTGIQNPRACWDLIRTKAGCSDLTLHDLRRTFASEALRSGMSLSQIGELLGHASAQTTKTYAWMVDEAAQTAANRVGDRMAGLIGMEIEDGAKASVETK